MTPPTESRLLNIPNILTLSRIPLSVVLFICISYQQWLLGFLTFLVASLTDWLDGWWARKYNQMSIFGRTFDPLVDKVLVGGAFIYLMLVPEAKLFPWMVTVVIGRELLITGIRGYLETLGKKFGADWFGKLKMGLQCAVLIAILFNLTLKDYPVDSHLLAWCIWIQVGLIYAMLFATIGSGIQYCWRAVRLVKTA